MHRVRVGFGAAALIAGVLLSVPGTNAQTGSSAGPVGSKIPSIVEQMVATLTSTAQAQRTVTTPAALSNAFVHVDSASRIQLAFHTDHPTTGAEEASLTALGATGITPLKLSGPLKLGNVGMVEAFVPAANVVAASNLSWVKAVTTPSYGHLDVGSVTSEGVVFHGADVAQTAGVDGTGVTVGVVSDGVTTIASSQGTNDLGAVNVLNAGSGDEGTAMLEIVHDMAPGAALAFAGTGGTVATHVNALNSLVGAGVNVIAEDIPFDDEPAFQVGLAAQTGENIAAAGVSMHSSAGNEGQRHAARVAATGTGQKPDGTGNAFAGCPKTPDNVVDIDPGAGTAFDISLGAGATLSAVLQWSEPRAVFPTVGQGGFTDLNFYIMDSGLTQCLASSTTVQANGVGDSIEQASFTAGAARTVKMVVDVESTGGQGTPIIDLRWRGGSAVDTTTRAGSLNPDSNYTGLATSSAAINANTNGIEGFSSGGPVQLGLTTSCGGNPAPCGNGVAGGGPVSTAGPTWAAADGVVVTGVGGFGSPFFGTSAAAPHAAACEALVRQNQPGLTVTQYRAFLISTAVDVAPAGTDNVTGAGRLVCAAQPRVTTNATTSVVITATGGTISDTATIANGYAPTGTVTFKVFGPADPTCVGPVRFTNNKAANGNGNVVSDPFSPPGEGTYQWVVSYAGNTNNAPAGSPCGAANEQSTVISICASPPPPGTLPGNNIVIAGPNLMTMGTAGNDVIYGTSGTDFIAGLGGDDIIFAGDGNDYVTGGDGNDTLCGGPGNDHLTGDAGNDLLVSGTGTDDLTGGAGADRIFGDTGMVRIDGGIDADSCKAGTGVGSATANCETLLP